MWMLKFFILLMFSPFPARSPPPSAQGGALSAPSPAQTTQRRRRPRMAQSQQDDTGDTVAASPFLVGKGSVVLFVVIAFTQKC